MAITIKAINLKPSILRTLINPNVFEVNQFKLKRKKKEEEKKTMRNHKAKFCFNQLTINHTNQSLIDEILKQINQRQWNHIFEQCRHITNLIAKCKFGLFCINADLLINRRCLEFCL